MQVNVRICKAGAAATHRGAQASNQDGNGSLHGFGRRRAGLGPVSRDGMMGSAERRSPMADARRHAALRCGALGLAALALALAAAGCGGGGPGHPAAGPSASASAKALPSCGTTKTAANVPVT